MFAKAGAISTKRPYDRESIILKRIKDQNRELLYLRQRVSESVQAEWLGLDVANLTTFGKWW